MDEIKYQNDLLHVMNQKLISEEKMLKLLVGTSSNAFIYYNFNSGKTQILGNWDHFFNFKIYDKTDLTKIISYCEDSYADALWNCLNLETTGQDRRTVQFCIHDKQIWVECETNVVYDALKHPQDKVIRFHDVTKMNKQNDELKYMAYYDTLTGLFNRNYFVLQLGRMIRKAEEENGNVAVMFVDIDDFRRINDGLGIVIGDELVQMVGQMLAEFQSDDVLVSHFNGDTYCMAIYDAVGANRVDYIYRKIKNRLDKPFHMSGGQSLTITVSAGIAEYPTAAQTTLELINAAEIVMFKAKGDGNGSIRYFDADILQDFLRSIQVESKLKNAVKDMRFQMHFQPQYKTKGKKLRGVEALIRWREEDGTMISPGVFIPVAENNGTIIPIGKFVIEESIRNYMEWKEKYSVDMKLSINISAIQYKQEDFIDSLLWILRKYKMNPKDLELEITESVLIDDYKNIVAKLEILREYGINISLDDFGTGYSSLSYLKGLPIDTLKIDKSFIDTVNTDENTRIIVESILFMAKRLKLETIAEGIETEEQFAYLDEIDCDNIQGFYLGKPMPADGVVQLIESLA